MITYNDYGLDKNPFNAVVPNRNIGVNGIVNAGTFIELFNKITDSSMPFALEGYPGSGRTTLIDKLSEELLIDFFSGIGKNILIKIKSLDAINQNDLLKYAYSMLICSILSEERFSGTVARIKGSKHLVDLPEEFVEANMSASVVMGRFGFPNLGLERLAAEIAPGGKIVFLLDDLDVVDEEQRSEFVGKWLRSVQTIPGVSTIYVGEENMDSNLCSGMPGYYSHSWVRMKPISKEDLKRILDMRIREASDGRLCVDDLLEEKIWMLLLEANHGESFTWILQTLGRIFEQYMKKEDKACLPVKYGLLEKYMCDYAEKSMNSVPEHLYPIIIRINEFFGHNNELMAFAEKLRRCDDENTKNMLLDQHWEAAGISKSSDKLVGWHVKIESDRVALPVSSLTMKQYLDELVKYGFLSSRMIRRRKYYLPTGDFMFHLKMISINDAK